MDKRKINKTFKEILEKAKLDYAISNADEYGDCNTCVNYKLASVFGNESNGIYLKHWLKGANAGKPYKYLNSIYIGHDITKEQGEKIIEILKNNGYVVEPTTYNPGISFKISERID